jgi:hypothetical protein
VSLDLFRRNDLNPCDPGFLRSRQGGVTDRQLTNAYGHENVNVLPYGTPLHFLSNGFVASECLMSARQRISADPD